MTIPKGTEQWECDLIAPSAAPGLTDAKCDAIRRSIHASFTEEPVELSRALIRAGYAAGQAHPQVPTREPTQEMSFPRRCCGKWDTCLELCAARTDHWRDSYHSAIGQGEVTVTCNPAGECVMVSRCDEDGQVLSVIWHRDAAPAASQAHPQGQGEPVAWVWCGCDGPKTKKLSWSKTNQWQFAPEGEYPLYAAPAAVAEPGDDGQSFAEQAMATLDGLNKAAKFLGLHTPAPDPAATAGPCPDGDACPDARKYGAVHPAKAQEPDALLRRLHSLAKWLDGFAPDHPQYADDLREAAERIEADAKTIRDNAELIDAFNNRIEADAEHIAAMDKAMDYAAVSLRKAEDRRETAEAWQKAHCLAQQSAEAARDQWEQRAGTYMDERGKAVALLREAEGCIDECDDYANFKERLSAFLAQADARSDKGAG